MVNNQCILFSFLIWGGKYRQKNLMMMFFLLFLHKILQTFELVKEASSIPSGKKEGI